MIKDLAIKRQSFLNKWKNLITIKRKVLDLKKHMLNYKKKSKSINNLFKDIIRNNKYMVPKFIDEMHYNLF